ncbi:DUF2795 domain-containing protein [Streptomyces verrucosisporus]|uniref:DUF2795 domain-containing protein n=1 Tax=Streptomyces verrucosisporus TaxID=1695161 RepID=UPI0019D05F4B|nr:DUF2795 domain-containing protein [Streptomyces verrucosisporus]MBN3929524.1 DUF2795 domain-containing protein [Streptomyces verrucosisporus]
MATHGRNKTGPARDDELKHEMEGELRAGRSLRMEEDHELQPSGEDQPDVDRAPDTVLTGGTPPGMDHGDVEVRSELARHLGLGLYPADRDAVLGKLRENNAPDRLLGLAERLPAGQEFRNIQDIARALGLGVEDTSHRT